MKKTNTSKLIKNTRYNFVMVDNKLLDSKKISFGAKGLYAYLTSKPDKWNFSIKRIATHTDSSEKTIRRLLQELERVGLLERKKEKKGSKFVGITYILNDYTEDYNERKERYERHLKDILTKHEDLDIMEVREILKGLDLKEKDYTKLELEKIILKETAKKETSNYIIKNKNGIKEEKNEEETYNERKIKISKYLTELLDKYEELDIESLKEIISLLNFRERDYTKEELEGIVIKKIEENRIPDYFTEENKEEIEYKNEEEAYNEKKERYERHLTKLLDKYKELDIEDLKEIVLLLNFKERDYTKEELEGIVLKKIKEKRIPEL